MEFRDHASVVVGAVIVVLLQLVVAPNIAIFSAMPNFILVYCLLVAIVRPATAGPVLPFVLGLVSDFAIGTPIGSTALLLVLFSFLASRAFSVLNNDTFFVPLVVIAVASFAVELLLGAFSLSIGVDVDLMSAIVYRALTCGLYDCVAALVLYPLASRLLTPPSPMGPGTPAHL